jgi:hypothetical protein
MKYIVIHNRKVLGETEDMKPIGLSDFILFEGEYREVYRIGLLGGNPDYRVITVSDALENSES